MSLTYESFLTALHEQYVLPIIRMQESQDCLEFCQVLQENGFGILEITLTTTDALQIIETLSHRGVKVGAGTVINAQEAQQAIEAGSQYLISPGLNLEILAVTQKYDIPYLPGVLTPSEIQVAYQAGLTCLKLFPASSVGTDYIKHLKGPFPQVRFLPTGGIQFAEIPDYMKEGAWAIGQGTRLVSDEFLKARNWPAIAKEIQQIKEQLTIWKQEFLRKS